MGGSGHCLHFSDELEALSAYLEKWRKRDAF
jgi:hypothetical protein